MILTVSSVRSALSGPWAYAIEYNWELPAAICTAVPHLSIQFVLSLDHFSVPSVLPLRDCFDQFNTRPSKCIQHHQQRLCKILWTGVNLLL